ncbi:MAG: hypothetical protein SFV15_13805 [Polyangiaceae bacterium]|nr:hypothetical protein [Polyangiaceae bacterium]
MPRCYFLTLCGGSSLDQQSNNVTLFNLVEQVSLAPGPCPVGALLPLEIHAYFQFAPSELKQTIQLRYSVVAQSGLETTTDVFDHRALTPHYRTRTAGLPLPPVTGSYELRVDWRQAGTEGWTRESITWPLTISEAESRPITTH